MKATTIKRLTRLEASTRVRLAQLLRTYEYTDGQGQRVIETGYEIPHGAKVYPIYEVTE